MYNKYKGVGYAFGWSNYYFNKLREYGLYASSKRIALRRIKNVWSAMYWKSKVLSRTAHDDWQTIAQKNKLPQDFATYWHSISRSFQFVSYVLKIVPSEYGMWVDSAEEFIQNYQDFVSRTTDDDPPWHDQFPAQTFYQDIALTSSTTYELSHDIKIPWERSRFSTYCCIG